jgi:predicted DNA-binding transcriptional regulator YafY
MYHPTTRVLAVLELLQSHRRMTGSELARRVEVNVRTLRRYITMLQDLGIPILAERGRYGAYELIPGFKLPPMMFTNDEALALAIGLLAAKRLGLNETSHTIESARAKLERVMPIELKEQVRALTETILLDLDESRTTSSTETMMTLSRAAQLQHTVTLRYLSGENEETERGLDPYGLTHYGGRWYAVGHCHLRNDLRSFRLDRMQDVKLTDLPFERPSNFDALDYLVKKIATIPRQFNFEILLKTEPGSAQSEITDMLGVLEQREDGLLLRGSTDNLDWLARQLARFPFDFVIHEPEGLREALRKRAMELMDMAELRGE